MKRSLFPKGDAQYINRMNKIKVLNLIRESRGISRAGIAQISGLSAPTVTRVVDSLIRKEGLITEIGAGKSSGGRRPTQLEFYGSNSFVIGIDLGTTNIYGVLCNLNADTIAEVKKSTRVEEGFEAVISRTCQIIRELYNHPAVEGKHIFGVGMAVAGLINRKKNIIEFSPDFHWQNADLLTAMNEKCGYPIIYDNVTRVMALGELWYGIGREKKNFICVNVGYGIGAGIIINGKPLYGPLGYAGEFGHITLEKDSSARCECGNFGCLEALASGNAIAHAAQNNIKEAGKTLLMDLCGGDVTAISTELVAHAARMGDEFALQIFNRAIEYLGIGIAGLINLFSSEAVIIGGGVAQAGDILFNKVKKIVNARAITSISRNVIIRPAAFGTKAAAMGAIALILNEVLNLNFKISIHHENDTIFDWYDGR